MQRERQNRTRVKAKRADSFLTWRESGLTSLASCGGSERADSSQIPPNLWRKRHFRHLQSVSGWFRPPSPKGYGAVSPPKREAQCFQSGRLQDVNSAVQRFRTASVRMASTRFLWSFQKQQRTALQRRRLKRGEWGRNTHGTFLARGILQRVEWTEYRNLTSEGWCLWFLCFRRAHHKARGRCCSA